MFDEDGALLKHMAQYGRTLGGSAPLTKALWQTPSPATMQEREDDKTRQTGGRHQERFLNLKP